MGGGDASPVVLEEPVNFANLAATIGPEVAIDVLKVYATSTSELVFELQTAVRRKDETNALARLGELGNACTVIGAGRMAAICQVLDELIHRHDWKLTAASMIDLSAEYIRLCDFLRKLFHTE
jgi:hypothetical protein